MPDIYSVSSVPTKAGKKETAVKGVNANFVLQQVLKQLNAEARKEIILRCDELPMLQGTEEEIQTLFSSLLQMIFIKKDSVPQLFLHIHCKNGLEEPLLQEAGSFIPSSSTPTLRPVPTGCRSTAMNLKQWPHWFKNITAALR